jgi:hypothetical protein
LKPYWGKPTVRNFRGDDGNGGIIRSRAASLVVVPVGEESHQRRGPATAVVISSGGEGDRAVESLEVKAPDGRETGQIRSGGRATWQAAANV